MVKVAMTVSVPCLSMFSSRSLGLAEPVANDVAIVELVLSAPIDRFDDFLRRAERPFAWKGTTVRHALGAVPVPVR